jgi:hypothetical protein
MRLLALHEYLLEQRATHPTHIAPKPAATGGSAARAAAASRGSKVIDPPMPKSRNRVGRDFGWRVCAHGAVSRRPPICLDTLVPRTGR